MKKRFLFLLLPMLLCSISITSCGRYREEQEAWDHSKPAIHCVCIDGKIYAFGEMELTEEEKQLELPEHPVIAGYITKKIETSRPFVWADDAWTLEGIHGDGYPYAKVSEDCVFVYGPVEGWRRFVYYSEADDFSWEKRRKLP